MDDLRYRDLKYLAIDEIYVGRKKKFYTVVIDLESGRIVWVAHGRGGDCLRKLWRRLRLAKAKIVAVAMDMSAAYWKAVRENLREAAIVFDKFHIVKLVNEKLDELRRDLVRQAEGLLNTSIKGLRYFLLTRRDHLAADKHAHVGYGVEIQSAAVHRLLSERRTQLALGTANGGSDEGFFRRLVSPRHTNRHPPVSIPGEDFAEPWLRHLELVYASH